jgi:phage terminase small subunit
MSDAAPTAATPKRGRGRPAGSYGKYRPRLPPELKEPDELNPLARELNSAPELNPELNEEPSRQKSNRRNGIGKTGFLTNPRWEAFARNIAKGMSGTKAYQAAGYETDERAAQSSASDLLSRPIVANRVEELKAAAAKAALITPARVLDETGKIAFAKVADDHGDLSALNREQIGALNIKRAALADLGKYMGMSKEKVEHSGVGGGPLQIEVLHSLLLQPQVLDRLSDDQVTVLRSAIQLLALPAPSQIIEVVAQPIVEAAVNQASKIDSGCCPDVADAREQDDRADEAGEG